MKSVSGVSDRRRSLSDKHFDEFKVERAVRLGRERNKGVFETVIQQSGGVEKETTVALLQLRGGELMEKRRSRKVALVDLCRQSPLPGSSRL